jgi:hypothetical protein
MFRRYFATPAKQAFTKMVDDPAFMAYMKTNGYAFDKPMTTNEMRLCLQWMQNSTNFSTAVVGWITLEMEATAHWEQAFPQYRKVASARPNDFPPKALVLWRTVETKAQANEWLALLKEAYTVASDPKERFFCLATLPAQVSNIARISGASGTLDDLSAWLDHLAKTETIDRLPALPELDFFKFFLAFARNDFSLAAKLAPATRMKAMQPLLLLMAQQPADARKALEKLKADSTLAESAKRLLQATGSLLDDLESSNHTAPFPAPERGTNSNR